MSAEYTPRFIGIKKEVVKEMVKKYKYANDMQAPRLEKIVISCSHNAAKEDAKYLDEAVAQIERITGQKAKRTRTRKAISNFKTKEGQPIGCAVTLRRYRMWEFMDRFINIAVPRMRDFRGLSKKSFDKAGNYSIGLKDIAIFPEMQIRKVTKTVGVGITFCIKASSVDEAVTYLGMLGVPFKK
ncbi:MAG: 50S ribosomal protein L5 [Elusimicrobia bacterium HGW-Elusimicrobia-2]|nr:MAG: 50S ribosomal protein L5 [Elusimicrobia bacterium HGW-Elusimicrobia-2]